MTFRKLEVKIGKNKRCTEGREVAMSKGTKFGRNRINTKPLQFALEMVAKKEMSIRKICEATGVAKATLCRRIAELKIAEEISI